MKMPTGETLFLATMAAASLGITAVAFKTIPVLRRIAEACESAADTAFWSACEADLDEDDDQTGEPILSAEEEATWSALIEDLAPPSLTQRVRSLFTRKGI
jgi:hypothetical protein